MGRAASIGFLVSLAIFVVTAWADNLKAFAQFGGHGAPMRPPASVPRLPATNRLNGELLVPAGRNFVGARDGRVYVPAGPAGGVIDTRGGKFAPTR
jgi:hypothetical protein